MTTSPAAPDGAEQTPAAPRHRLALIMPVLIAAFSLFLVIRGIALPAADADFPGPRFVPVILGGAGLVLAALLALQEIRSPEGEVEDDGTPRPRTDVKAVAWVVLGFLAFALLLPWLGWILAGALLFWFTSRGFGSARPALDALIALFLSSLVYLIFGTGLGLQLPSGILGGGF